MVGSRRTPWLSCRLSGAYASSAWLSRSASSTWRTLAGNTMAPFPPASTQEGRHTDTKKENKQQWREEKLQKQALSSHFNHRSFFNTKKTHMYIAKIKGEVLPQY